MTEHLTEYACEKCTKPFETAEALAMHNQAKHPESMPKKSFSLKPQQKKKIRNWGIVVVMFGLFIWGIYALVAGSETGAEKDQRVPAGAIHWHPTLKIIIKGEEQVIPANLGLEAVHLPIHTHDPSGILHYENNRPTAETMKLDFFFKKAWRKTFNSNCIFEYCNGPDGTVTMKVNGQPNTEFENFIPQGDDEIIIEYG